MTNQEINDRLMEAAIEDKKRDKGIPEQRSNQEIIQAATRKAEKNGFNDYMDIASKLKSVGKENLSDADIYIIMDSCRIFREKYLFSHEFAKAFWDIGDGKAVKDLTKEENIRLIENVSIENITGLEAWQYHLQMMVISEDPIQYLSQFLDD